VKLYDGIFGDARYTVVSEVLFTRSGGWAEAKNARKKVIEASVDAGVKCIEADAALFNKRFLHRSAGGRTFSAISIILYTGAGMAKLITDSAPG
jgi:hypothetical protein